MLLARYVFAVNIIILCNLCMHYTLLLQQLAVNNDAAAHLKSFRCFGTLMTMLARFSNYHQAEVSCQKIRIFLAPYFWERVPKFFQHFLIPTSCYQLAKLGWLAHSDLHERRSAKKQFAAFVEGGCIWRSSFDHLWSKVYELLSKCKWYAVVSNAFSFFLITFCYEDRWH